MGNHHIDNIVVCRPSQLFSLVHNNDYLSVCNQTNQIFREKKLYKRLHDLYRLNVALLKFPDVCIGKLD